MDRPGALSFSLTPDEYEAIRHALRMHAGRFAADSPQRARFAVVADEIERQGAAYLTNADEDTTDD